MNFQRLSDVVLLLACLPFALGGGLILVALLHFKLSVAVAVGFIALAGLSIATSALMLQVLRANILPAANLDQHRLHKAIIETASLRLRPVIMTTTAMMAGLMPIMFGSEPGSEVMARIAAPVIGGLCSSLVVTLFVLPVCYLTLLERNINRI